MEITDIILCEDIRKELGNKSSLMGIFGDSITVNVLSSAQKPPTLRLCLFFRVARDEDEPVPDHTKCTIERDGEEPVNIDGPLKVESKGRLFSVDLRGVPVPLDKNCNLVIKIAVLSGGSVAVEKTIPYPIALKINSVVPS